MDPLTPWLLLIVAALIVACVSLYYQLRQGESQARGQQAVLSDELRDAEAALLSALDRLQEMDQTLARREQSLLRWSQAVTTTSETPLASSESATAGLPREPSERVDGRIPPNHRHAEFFRTPANSGTLAPHTSPEASGEPRLAPPTSGTPWRPRAVALSRAGLTPVQIARELGLPVGEVELVLTLAVVPEGGSVNRR